MLIVVMLNEVMQGANVLSVIMPSVSIQCVIYNAKCFYAECHNRNAVILCVIMLNVITLSVIMLNSLSCVIKLNVIMLSVVLPTVVVPQ
jgi:hypothetical protein